MRIFVTGATGYIGNAVSTALARAGHHVWGLTRSSDKTNLLARQEITPVVGTMTDPNPYRQILRESQVIIHCAAEYNQNFLGIDRQAAEEILNTIRNTQAPHLFLYTSGVWVYGNTGSGAVDEASPLNPPSSLSPRVETERFVLAQQSSTLCASVIRPGCVYGRRGGLTGFWFESAVNKGAVSIVGEGANRWAMIHVDDLAHLYSRVVESYAGGEVFNAVNRDRHTVVENAMAVGAAVGTRSQINHLSQDQAAEIFGPMTQGLLLNQYADASKAERLLNWRAKQPAFADNAPLYFAAWKASRESIA